AHSSTPGGRKLCSSQAPRTATSTLWPNIAPGSDRTPSLTTITSCSPSFSAQRDGTNSSSPDLPGREFSKLMVVSSFFSNFVEESAIACFELCMKFPSQYFLIDVSDDESLSRTLAS